MLYYDYQSSKLVSKQGQIKYHQFFPEIIGALRREPVSLIFISETCRRAFHVFLDLTSIPDLRGHCAFDR